MEDIIDFRIEEDTDVSLECPWCFASLWITDAKTLGDVLDAARAHDCNEGDE